ncbi:MAG: DUF1638 domain-containing protein [Clostridia bacterium]|nr:DUF1638 domain-containing protein [Clostridia bacterium]
MSTVILACRTIADELNRAIKVTRVDYPVFWVESGLHNYPDNLRRRIQDEIDRIGNVSCIILVFGYCGNSLLGLKSNEARLVFPRVDDCISLLLGSFQTRQTLSREMTSYFLTRGWIDYESSLWKEYDHCVKRYGPEKTWKIMKIMLNHYKRLVLIDTGAYDLDGYLEKTGAFAQTFGLKHQVVPGSLRLLEKLLRGPWDEEFVIIEPGEEIGLEHLLLEGGDEEESQVLFRFR